MARTEAPAAMEAGATSQALPTVVIGTAGHIDHGKTSLLRALTGIDADRLPEERARGMTIDVGYAHLAFDDGVEIDFVDVPGHERLIGNMLVGAGEIDAAMLVVAADDGPRPQTLEHLALLDALRVDRGLAVVTKVDLVDEGRLADVVGEVRGLLAGTSLDAAPVLPASAATREGLAEVRAAVRTLRDAVAADPSRGPGGGPLRLSVDRAFTVKGRGAVVTGTLWGGALERGMTLRREPGGEEVRVRAIQVHGSARERSEGGRTAVNVAGVAAQELRRGDVLTTDPRVRATSRLLVALRVGFVPPRAGAVVRLHIGTHQVDATVRRITGEAAALLLTLPRDVAAFPGERAVLREPASGRIVAGVVVLDPLPPRGASRRRLTAERVAALRAGVERGWGQDVGALIDLHGALVLDATDGPPPTPRTLTLAADIRTALDSAALEAVRAHHAAAPVSPGLPLPRARAAVLRRLRSLATVERRDLDLVAVTVARVVNHLVSEGQLLRRDDLLRDPSIAAEQPPALVEAMDRLERALDVPAPPPLADAATEAGCPPQGVQALQAAGRIVRLAPDLAWSAREFQRLASVALSAAREAPLSPAAFRDATGTSRKYVLAILEDLDRRQILERTPEGHVPGPRAPRPEPGGGAQPARDREPATPA